MFRAASLVPKHNHWRRVFDFNKGEAAVPEPHWTIMREVLPGTLHVSIASVCGVTASRLAPSLLRS